MRDARAESEFAAQQRHQAKQRFRRIRIDRCSVRGIEARRNPPRDDYDLTVGLCVGLVVFVTFPTRFAVIGCARVRDLLTFPR